MRKKVPFVLLVHLLTFVLLVTFQVLFILTSSIQQHWEVYAICLAMDGILVVAYFRASKFRRAGELSHFQDLDEELRRFLELTRRHQEHWQSTLKGLADVKPEDLPATGEVRELLASLNTVRQPLDAAVGAETTESMAQAIPSLLQLNLALMDDLDRVFGFYHQTYLKLRTIQAEYRLNHFRLRAAVDFLNQMGNRTTHYSEKLVLDVLDSFKEITRYAEGITSNVLDRIHLLMDSKNPESLDAISEGSVKIHETMDAFFVELGRANTFSQNAVTGNLSQMARVREMAEAIAEFSESIRMISLNLNIEAARVHQGNTEAAGKGFQVLATNLSAFAVRARELAEQQHVIIDSASTVMAHSGQAQMEKLANLMEEIPRIKGQLDPFDSIIAHSFSHFENVVATMEHLSESINDKLKAVIGKFQFQDLVRQEQEHALLLFTHLRDLSDKISDDGVRLNDAATTKALEELLRVFEQMASTENEHAVLREFRKKAHLSSKDGDSDEVTAGSVSLF